MCVRRRTLPPTVKNLHLPDCIGETSQQRLRLQILKKMKRGLRFSLEAAKRKTRQLNSNLESLSIEDRERLRRGRTRAFNTTYNSASEHFRGKLRRLCEREGRPEVLTGHPASPRTAHTDRVTDKTLELTTVEKELLSRGPRSTRGHKKPDKHLLPASPTSTAGASRGTKDESTQTPAETPATTYPTSQGALASTCPQRTRTRRANSGGSTTPS